MADRVIRRLGGRLDAADRDAATRLLMILRPSLDPAAAAAFLNDAMASGYELALLSEDAAEPSALAGFRILPTSRGRVLMLDDLVTAPARRGAGVGAALLSWVFDAARDAGCERVELDTGTSNTAAQAFYERNGMRPMAVHFAASVPAARLPAHGREAGRAAPPPSAG